ncbi:PREDICTED: pre-mRNA-splicing factor ISY1 homolog isoform X1 [Myotis brandtii]|uniref:pre-mRNA-splicing factor ISY1 homolog isoform X1 n=1 Tax=Myotis brandtii TaxID=109478 RepID=UPI00070428DB|nr:PREDICTED: pre-mRNA-splicing factor ISY1 homolog isoform X1 [Myotis brandtii]
MLILRSVKSEQTFRKKQALRVLQSPKNTQARAVRASQMRREPKAQVPRCTNSKVPFPRLPSALGSGSSVLHWTNGWSSLPLQVQGSEKLPSSHQLFRNSSKKGMALQLEARRPRIPRETPKFIRCVKGTQWGTMGPCWYLTSGLGPLGGPGYEERRPFLASECTELPKAEKWRRQIIGEISKKVAQIQNAGLGEFRIRDLNDEINKLLREKGHWEVRIKELGGPDYVKVGPKMLDHEGKEVPGNRGYKYFGAAKDLPGVRELFEKEPLPPPRKTRAELMKAIDFEYYGYLDEDDGVIVPLEQEYEKKFRAQLVEKWKAEREARLARGEKEEEEEEEEEINIYAVTEEESDEEGSQEKGGEDEQQKFIAHVPVPSQQEIEEALVRRKKMELLQKYASETLQAQSEEAKRLMGY